MKPILKYCSFPAGGERLFHWFICSRVSLAVAVTPEPGVRVLAAAVEPGADVHGRSNWGHQSKRVKIWFPVATEETFKTKFFRDLKKILGCQNCESFAKAPEALGTSIHNELEVCKGVNISDRMKHLAKKHGITVKQSSQIGKRTAAHFTTKVEITTQWTVSKTIRNG